MRYAHIHMMLREAVLQGLVSVFFWFGFVVYAPALVLFIARSCFLPELNTLSCLMLLLLTRVLICLRVYPVSGVRSDGIAMHLIPLLSRRSAFLPNEMPEPATCHLALTLRPCAPCAVLNRPIHSTTIFLTLSSLHQIPPSTQKQGRMDLELSVTPFELNELLLCARYGEPDDLNDIQTFVAKYGTSWLETARDERGNTMLHMAGGNGHQG